MSEHVKYSDVNIPGDLIPGLSELSGPALIYFESGRAQRGFVLRDDEFVTSLSGFAEMLHLAGLKKWESG
ncbi:hypothetical protein [Mixta intestinalis]|nr:hypothetical protein [Mixta intestinalis]